MSKVLERVARALEPQAWAALGTGDTLAYKNRRVSSLRKARAAIEAIREPTEEMMQAACDAAFQPVSLTSEEAYELGWRSMIDAILNEKEERT